MKISITQVPQADELSKVILAVEAVSQENTTDKRIADYVGFTDRQGRYYRLAAEILGLLTNDRHYNHASLTDAGRELIVLDESNRLKKIRTILKENILFKTVLGEIEGSRQGLSRDELLAFLYQTIDGSESTIQRRLSTIINWLTYSSLIVTDFRETTEEKDRDTVYKINDLLDETDFITPEDFRDSIYPSNYSNEELDIKELHTMVVSILRRKEQGKIIVPEFQRNHVWKPQQKSRFIESLILNIPIPPFYVSQDLEGKWIMVDGLQRSTAIFEFLNNKYPLVGLEALPNLNEKLYNQLDDDLKSRIEEREMLFYILKPSVPMSIVYDIFNRINSNGTTLTRQEIRNCIYSGPATRLLAKLADHRIFKEAIDGGISPLRMKDQEAVLRFFAFSANGALDEYNGDLDDFLGKTMRNINRMNQSQLEKLSNSFFRTMKFSFDFFGEHNFRLPTEKSRGVINIALFEVISVFFDKLSDEELLENKEKIIYNYYNVLLPDEEFKNSIRNATNNIRNVRMRFHKTFSILNPRGDDQTFSN
ncbi:DUF262 domain-containing protein [Alistipes senegalensis]|uniref:DUF262 domain-containing protein n=1 Tax=Alistipes senegalensis JC50 TaxID=1033732 RepID=A0ABY5V9S4_9BACT|nr:DUF262 domain-containing protein [Alistipes senegalensis]UEA86159.1 DUF262 domain-containing protein [Alistipes senegalensis]UWN66256.1 DUF262 domain-containing protein [Alistipes senegalensis JC50]